VTGSDIDALIGSIRRHLDRAGARANEMGDTLITDELGAALADLDALAAAL